MDAPHELYYLGHIQRPHCKVIIVMATMLVTTWEGARQLSDLQSLFLFPFPLFSTDQMGDRMPRRERHSVGLDTTHQGCFRLKFSAYFRVFFMSGSINLVQSVLGTVHQSNLQNPMHLGFRATCQPVVVYKESSGLPEMMAKCKNILNH